MNQLLTIQNDIIVIDNLSVTTNLNVANTLQVTGESVIHLLTADTIVADTLRVKNLITDNEQEKDLTPNAEWIANTTDDLNGRGLKWIHNTETTQLIYRSGGRLWNSNSFDIPSDASYRIDDVPVISATSLGPSISKSSLRQVGPLTALTVHGDTSLSGFAFFNSTSNRLGLGTSEPSASISIVDNNVEISIGSPVYNLANIGTRSNHDVAIISDNLPRLVVKNNGEVHIGNELSKTGVLRVFGSLYADSVVSDTRIERTTSLEFNTSASSSIYGKGLLWSGVGALKQFILSELPDRFWSTESIDIVAGRSYYINGTEVLSETAIGNNITDSKLTSVGELKSLSVLGTVTFDSGITSASHVNTPVVNIADSITINTNGLDAKSKLVLSVNESVVLYSDPNEIVLGNKLNATTPIKVFGPLSIGINNPDPTVSLSVNGDVSFNNKKFVTGIAAPVIGSFVKGDICWNENPTATGYVGWICLQTGTPGEWKPFGLIGV